jgi:L-lactate dehydrogenase complex protein LldE
MIRDQYPGLIHELGNTELQQQFEALLPRIYELSEFLIDKLGVDDVGAYFPHRVTYHASCHGVRALHLGERPFRLLSKVAEHSR